MATAHEIALIAAKKAAKAAYHDTMKKIAAHRAAKKVATASADKPKVSRNLLKTASDLAKKYKI